MNLRGIMQSEISLRKSYHEKSNSGLKCHSLLLQQAIVGRAVVNKQYFFTRKE